MIKDSLALARDIVLRPGKAFERFARADRPALAASGLIFAVYVATAVLFYTLKPEDFPPPPEGALPYSGPRGLLFWIKVHAWDLPLTALLIGATGWFAGLLTGSWLPLRLFTAILTPLIPFLLVFLDANSLIPRWACLSALAVLAALAVPGLRRVEKKTWAGIAAVLMSVNAAAIAVLPVCVAAVLLRSEGLYHALEILLAFWILGLATKGVSAATGLGTGRSFWAVLLGSLCQILLVFSLFMTGLLPIEVLKALLAF